MATTAVPPKPDSSSQWGGRDEEPVHKFVDEDGSSGSTNGAADSHAFRDAQPPEDAMPFGEDATPAEKDALREQFSQQYLHLVAEGKPQPECPGDERDFLITWIGENDPGMPVNWPLWTKALMLTDCALVALSTVFGSAVIGPGIEDIMAHFHVGLPVATLNVSLYVLGFGLGPMVWGPMSEMVGRKLPIVLGMFGLTVFAFACASAANFQTLVLCRFFAGALGSSTISVTPAVTSDMFATKQRGTAVAVVCLMIFAGPMLAPVIGGYIAASFLGWRWTQYIWGILSALGLVMSLFLKETYGPKLLANRAADIRRKTGNWAISAPLEKSELDTSELLQRTVLKPIRMLVIEPILLLISIYHGFIYGILYLCLEAVPIVFGDYGWKGGNIYLPYLGMFVGAVACSATSVYVFEPIFLKKLAKSKYPTIPEERLIMMMVSGISFAVGIFLLCWSGAYFVFWFVPVLGTFFIGFGLVGIFLAAFNYIIDTYLILAASALSANTIMRSSFGCAFPLFVHPMFKNLGTQWAGTLLGCLASVLAPVPFVFYFFGARIRAKSKYAANFEELEVALSRHSTHPSMTH